MKNVRYVIMCNDKWIMFFYSEDEVGARLEADTIPELLSLFGEYASGIDLRDADYVPDVDSDGAFVIDGTTYQIIREEYEHTNITADDFAEIQNFAHADKSEIDDNL